MDNRINKARLKQLLSYDLWKIIALIVAGVFVWSLLFTMLGDSLSEGQSLNVYAYNVSVSENELNKLLQVGWKNNRYTESGDFKSYEVHETQYHNFGRFSASDTTVAQQFTAWSSVGQLDVFFVSIDPHEDLVKTVEGANGEETEVNYCLAERYLGTYYDLDSLVKDAVNYCKTKAGYTDGGKSAVSDDRILQLFSNRKRRDNFYRHGLIDGEMEIARFEKLWAAATRLKALLEDDTVDIWYTADAGGTPKRYGVDLGKLGAYGKDENGVVVKNPGRLCSSFNESINKSEGGNVVADGVALTVFNNAKQQPDLVYESLAFVVAVIGEYSLL